MWSSTVRIWAFLLFAEGLEAFHVGVFRLLGEGVGDVQPFARFMPGEVTATVVAAVERFDEVRCVGVAVAGEGTVMHGTVMIGRKLVVIDDLCGNATLVRRQFRPLRRTEFDGVFFVVLRQFVVGGRDFEGRRGLACRDGQGFGHGLGEVGVTAVAVFEGDGDGYRLVARFIQADGVARFFAFFDAVAAADADLRRLGRRVGSNVGRGAFPDFSAWCALSS